LQDIGARRSRQPQSRGSRRRDTKTKVAIAPAELIAQPGLDGIEGAEQLEAAGNLEQQIFRCLDAYR
jgi:hypothetical protein